MVRKWKQTTEDFTIMILLRLTLITIGFILAIGSLFWGIDGIVTLIKGENLGIYAQWHFVLLTLLFIIFGFSLFLGCLSLLKSIFKKNQKKQN